MAAPSAFLITTRHLLFLGDVPQGPSATTSAASFIFAFTSPPFVVEDAIYLATPTSLVKGKYAGFGNWFKSGEATFIASPP